MDRSRIKRSYASRSAELPYIAQKEKEYNAYQTYLNKIKEEKAKQQRQAEYNLANEERKKEILREEQKANQPKKGKSAVMDNLPWEPNDQLPAGISRVGSVSDNRKKQNTYANFLEDSRNKMYDTVSNKYVDKPFFVEMAEHRHDPKVQSYIEMTNAQKAKDIANNKMMLSLKDYIESTKPEDYGVQDWISDAYNTYRIAQNQAQADDYEGQRIRSLEADDMAKRAIDFTKKQILLQSIQNFELAVEALNNAYLSKNENRSRLITAAQNQLNKAQQALQQYYGKNFDPYNNPGHLNKLRQDESKLKQNTVYSDDIANLRDLARNHGDMLTVTARAAMQPVSKLLQALGIVDDDITRDAVENDLYKTLVDLDIHDPRKRLILLNNYLNRSKNTKVNLEQKRKDEEAERDAITKPSEYFTNRVQMGSIRMANGESWWNSDNLLYSQIQQQGFSNSSWAAQTASMALTAIGSFLNDVPGGAVVGVPMVAAGAGFQYEAARAENNAEVVENAKKRVANALKGKYKNKGTNYYDNIIREAKKLSRYKDKSDDDILGDIVSGKLHVTSRVSDVIAQAINEEIINARQGANALYDKDMAAVASDAATDAIIWGTGGVPKFLSGTSRLGGKMLGASDRLLNNWSKYVIARQKIGQLSHKILTSKLATDAAIVSDMTMQSLKNSKLASAGKYIWHRGGDLSTYGRWLGQGGYIVGAVAKPTIAGLERVGSKISDSELGHQLLTSKFVTNTALIADRTVEFAKAIPEVLLKKTGKAVSKMSGVTEFEAQQFVKRQAPKIGNLIASGFSEQIEEGKQYLNAKEWVDNADPDQVANTFDITFGDLSKNIKLMPAAMGVPFGIRWGLAKDSELFENMSGGMLGGFFHGGTILAAKDILGEASYLTGLLTSLRSIDHMIATNAYLDNKSTIGRLETAQLLSKKIGSANVGKVLRELMEFEQFNNKQGEEGGTKIDQQLIDEQRNFILSVNSEYNSQDTQTQAEKAGIKKGSDDYNRFVAAKVLYKEAKNDAADNYRNAILQIEQYLNQSNFIDEDEILEQTVGATNDYENPILKLFENENIEEIEEKTMTRRERKAAKRAENKAKKAEKRREKLIERGESDEIAEEILNQTVASKQNTEDNDVQDTLDKSRKIKTGVQLITELLGLTDYLDSFTNISNYSDVNNKNDIDYIKQYIQNRINRLKQSLPADKIQHILNNKELYLGAIENGEELMDAYRTRIAALMDLDTAEMMLRLLQGKQLPGKQTTWYGAEKNIWGINNAREVLKKIQETIDDKYDLIDRVNQEFQHRNFEAQRDTQVNIEQAAADQELEDMLNSDQDIELELNNQTEESVQIEPEVENQPVIPSNPIQIINDAPGVEDVDNMIRSQEEAAAQAAVEEERANLNRAYRLKLADDNNATVVDDEESLTDDKFEKGDKIIVLNPNTKDYKLYTVLSKGNIVDEDGIYIVKNGKLIPEDQRNRSEELLGKNLTEQQRVALESLEQLIKDDNSKVVGVTGHDYFIREDDGKIHMYPRVHTIMGGQYEDSPEMDRDYPESKYNKNYNKIFDLIIDNETAELKELIKSVKNYQLYLDVLNQGDVSVEYIAQALAELVTQEKAGVGVNVGQAADELTRIFFDRNISEPFDYNTLLINLGFDDKTYPVSSIMQKDVFDKLKEDLILLLKKYDRLGYVLSTTRHTWHGRILVSGKYTNVAGETDIIAIDRAGKYHIIDTKTTKYSFKEGSTYFDQKGELYGRSAKRTTREQYAMQLSYYMAIIKSAIPEVQFAENPIELLPLIVKYDDIAMQHTILNLQNGQDPNSFAYNPISSISNGRNGEPQRITLTPVLEIINGTFDDKEDVKRKQKQVKQHKDDVVQKILNLSNDYAEKAEALKQHHPSLSNVLDSVKDKIYSIQQSIRDPHQKLKSELDGTELDNIESILQSLEEDIQTVQEELNSIYGSNITKVFDKPVQQPESPVQDEEIQPEKPTESYTDDKDGWFNYNTADRNNVNSIVSDDADKIRLNSVTGNDDFATNSVTEVDNIITEKGKYIIICNISYNGHNFKGVRIQIASNQNGTKLLDSVRQQLAFAKEGLKVVLTGMDRTAGIVNIVPEMSIDLSSAIMDNKTIYDLSTEHTQTTFGLAKMNKSGIVEVHAQGATKGTTTIIYTFKRGEGVPGTYYTIIKPKHNNATVPTKPLHMPMLGAKLSSDDVQLLMDVFDTIARYNNPNNLYEHLNSDGSSFNLPFTYKDLVDFFIPYGDVKSYNKARHVKIEGRNVIFTEYDSDGVTVKQNVYDLSDNNGRKNLQDYLKISIRMNISEDRVNSRLGLANGTNNHPFKSMATLFERHPELKQIQLGKSKIIFRRDDFTKPDGNKEGLSGLGWMARNGMITTTYGGINNPRFSYTRSEIVDNQTTPEVNQDQDVIEDITDIQEEDFELDNEFDIDDVGWEHTQTNLNPDRKAENAKNNLHRLFGSRVRVEVAARLSDIFKDVQFSAGAVGAMIKGAIGLQTNAERGTEYHESFHLVSRILLSKKMREKLYKFIKKIIERDEIQGTLQKLIEKDKNRAKKLNIDPEQYALEEYGAELCRQYFNRVEDIDFSLRKIFDYIKENIQALREIGDWRLATLFVSMRAGVFRLPGLRISKKQVSESEQWLSTATYNRNGVSYHHILNDCMYDKLIRSMAYYICRLQNVKPDGSNLQNLNLDKEFLENTNIPIKGKDEKIKIDERTGKPVRTTVKGAIILSSMTRVDGKKVKTPTSLAIEELFSNYDQTYRDLKRYMDEIGIDYHEKEEAEREDNMVDGEDQTEGGNTDHNYDKASYEKSKVTRATVGIKFYTSLIRDFGTIVEVKNPKTGKVEKSVEYKKNELGLYEFMDSRDVLVTILNKLHRVKSKKEMLNKILELAQSDPLFYLLNEMLSAKEFKLSKNGKTNYSNEQVLTQFFNLIASSKNNFMRVQAKRDRNTGMYTLSVEECGQKYEASQYRMEWGRMLTYGGTELFDRDENGNLIEKKIGNYTGVEYLGAMFDRIEEIRSEFTRANIERLMDHGKPNLMLINPKTGKRESCNIITEDGCNTVVNTLCSIFNRMGIQFNAPEFRYMLSEKYGSKGFNTIQSQLEQFFNQTGKESILNLYGSDSYKLLRKEKSGKWSLNVVDNLIISNKNGHKIPVENFFTNNAFTSELSEWKYKYQHSTSDLSVLIGGGKTYYEISENSTITDVTDDLATGGKMVENLLKFCYNFAKITGQDVEGNDVTRTIGSIILKRAIEAKERGVELPLQINTLTQFKTDDISDDGSGYFEISEREDYVSKCTILEEGGLVFPTMSDKKTWVYITGIQLPGLTYRGNKVEGLYDDEVLKQLVEYADLERMSVAQTIEQLKTLPDNLKVTNFHKGAKITDKSDNTHTVANGTIFGALTGIWVEDSKTGKLKFESFNDQLDSNENYITPEQNLAKADKLFFSKTEQEKMEIIKRTLEIRVDKEMQHLENLGIISKNQQGIYSNKGLNDSSLAAIARTKFEINDDQQVNEFQKNACIRDYVKDIVSKSIMSIHEVERCYSGHPGFFKYKFDKQGHLINRHEDEFKRFGGLISTGTNNNIDIEGAPEDGMYTCAVVNNEMVQSPQINYIVEKIATSEWRAALRQHLSKNVINKKELRNIWKRVSEMSLDEVKKELHGLSETAYNIVDAKVKKETDSYRKDKENKGIDVADGGAYISPEMTKWLLQMCGEYSNEVDKAFKILMNPDKFDVMSVEDAYSLVATKVIGAQKYTAYGQRLSADGKTMIPYYNKMALFPIFKCMATGRFAKIYKQMLENKDAEGNANPIHMLMVQSAIKLGDEGSVEYSTSSEFPGFHTYKQEFRFLRKQFNTNPHHKEDQSMGTQMVKVALTSLIKNKEYYIDEKGNPVTGENLLKMIMHNINKLTNIGRDEFRGLIRGENGEIDPKKFSEFLIDQMSSRDADKSMIDALSSVPIKDGENNTIGWKLKHPLAAISRMNWLLSVLKSVIDKRMVEVHTYGNAFYQRSIWGMEGKGADYVSDKTIAKDINNGEELKMIVEDGPAKGAMECVLTMDYFTDILKEAGLDKATFSEQRKALIEAGIIGPNAKANLIGYRIPTQAQSSIHALVCRDVIPVINHNIILPKEFTKITGSDFDIDKIFIASLNYNMSRNSDGTYSSETKSLNNKKKTQNDLLNCYLTLLCDEEGMHIANRSIDNDTDLVLDVLDDLESGQKKNSKYEPVDSYDFYTLSKHTSTKLNFLTGKTGIGPFALNNNSQILTTLYNVEFSENSFMNKLKRTSLHDASDMDGQSIMSWISALINAHVDIAKDPYISRMNVNEMTYNLVNLLIRTGYGKRTFYFTKQPAMLKMAEKYRQAQGSFLQDKTRSKWEIKNEAKQDGVVELVGQATFDLITEFLNVTEQKPLGDISKFGKYLLEGDVLRKIARGDISLESTNAYKVGSHMFTPAQIQVLVYYLDKALEKPAQSLSDLVKYSKIDTKKQGKNVSEQLAYLRGVANTFDDPNLTSNLFGNTDIETVSDATIEDELESRPEFKRSGLNSMYKDSFIKYKTQEAITEFMHTMSGQVFEATPGFLNLLSRLCLYFNKYDANSISTIVQAVSAKIKADAINEYADRMGIDIHGLVSGNNTIYDRLNSIKIRLKSDPEYADIANNPLLNLLIADKHWKYDFRLHSGNVQDRFQNLKFIRLFDALDKSNSKTDYIISAWEQLLENGNHPEIREFARDLCVYAFVTSGDKGGRTKLFNYVPNSFREQSGYVQSIESALERMKIGTAFGAENFTDNFIDDIVLNNQDSDVFVKSIDVSNKKWKPGKPKWKTVIVNQPMKIGKDALGNDISYKPSYPIFITVNVDTPVKADSVSPFIKVTHMTRSNNDNSSRSESIYKLVSFVPSENGTGYPLYVKVNTKGYHIKGGYDFYEYGRNIQDAEYVPNIYNINSMIGNIRKNKDAWNAVYGNEFTYAAEMIADNYMVGMVGYQQTSNYNPNQTRVVEVEDNVVNNTEIEQTESNTNLQTQPSQQSNEIEEINIYAGTNENADLSNFAIRPFSFEVAADNMEYAKIGKRTRQDNEEGVQPEIITFQSVEQAFQYYKTLYSVSGLRKADVKKLQDKILSTTNGSSLRSLGRQVTLDTKIWDLCSNNIMKMLIKASFEQNPKATQRLLATGDATLTHTQDKGKWGKEFPKLLMEVREELRSENINQELKQQEEQPQYDAKIQYTPTGKERQTYYIKGSHIYNKDGKEVFAKESADRTKIFANLAIQQGRAVVVEYNGSKYVVNNKNMIVSVLTGKIMQWGEENGDRRNILGMAKPRLENVARLMKENKKGDSNENLKC